MTDPAVPPMVLWTPEPARVDASAMTAFRHLAAERTGRPLPDYDALWAWSVQDLDDFWSLLAEYTDVDFVTPPTSTLVAPDPAGPDAAGPGAQWFPGATLNYAAHALRPGPGRADDDVAIVARAEDGSREVLRHRELREQVTAVRTALADLGVGPGDRVAALLPTVTESVIAFLATASLGAVWSSCSPDFGAAAVVDRFAQIEPTVLLAVDRYRYAGREHDVTDTVRRVRAALDPTVTTVWVTRPADDVGTGTPLPKLPGPVRTWSELLRTGRAAPAPTPILPVPFNHPLWILYSSGTTGLPKGIVHGHGGILLEHLKMLRLHSDLRPGDAFCWFTTTGWMMWNYLVSGLLVGARVVLYDGSPTHPDLDVLWRVAEEEQLTWLGASAPWVHACRDAGLTPGSTHDLSGLHTLGSTGSPLSPEGFDWVAGAVGDHVQVASISGGTDLCTAFLAAAPDRPVWRGELSARALGADARAVDARGHDVVEEVGELVLRSPMPSMPVALWGDDDGTRLRAAYFSDIPGAWRHGDWVTVTGRGSVVVHGRSDATLNRGGVRMGTAEFYRVVERHPGVADSLVVDVPGDGGSRLLCFVVPAAGYRVAELVSELRALLRREISPRHVPDAFLEVEAVPRTLNGKKCEVPVKAILSGADPGRAVSRDALADPAALDAVIAAARAAQPQPR